MPVRNDNEAQVDKDVSDWDIHGLGCPRGAKPIAVYLTRVLG